MTELEKTRKEDKVDIHNALEALKTRVDKYKEKRKTEWKSFKNKYEEELEKVEKSIEKLSTLQKRASKKVWLSIAPFCDKTTNQIKITIWPQEGLDH